MKRSICLILFAIIITQSCVVYQTTPVPVEKAVDKGKVKFVANDTIYRFEKIKLYDDKYYGMNYGKNGYKRMMLDDSAYVYLKDVEKSKKKSKILVVSILLGIPVLLISAWAVIYTYG